jgi:hypothetical protein
VNGDNRAVIMERADPCEPAPLRCPAMPRRAWPLVRETTFDLRSAFIEVVVFP